MDAYDLIEKGVQHIHRESLQSSVQMGSDVLSELGFRKYTTQRKATQFIKYDQDALYRLSKARHDTESYATSVREEIALQEKLLNEDSRFTEHRPDNAWDKSIMG